METPEKTSYLKRAFDKTYWLWIVIIVFDLISQCLRSANMRPDREAFISKFVVRMQLQYLTSTFFPARVETVVTTILVVEIFLRFVVDWRKFHNNRRNWVDLGLAVITAVIQLPPIHRSQQTYAWLSFFQILRIYRVVLAVPLTRDLIVRLGKKISG